MARVRHRILLVESEGRLRSQLQRLTQELGIIDTESGVPTARARLLKNRYDWLITNIRLEAYNGLQLAYLAYVAGKPIRILIYGEEEDLTLAREAQRLGAFFESRALITRTVNGYLTGTLPAADRRDPGRRDRREPIRGGRRAYDGAWLLVH